MGKISSDQLRKIEKNQPLDHSTAEKIKENAIYWPFSQPWGKLTQIGLENSIGALLIGGCGARAVSRKTHIYFIYSCYYRVFKSTQFIGAFQAAKGVLTAGPRKAVKYAGAKLKKMFKSLMEKWALSKSQMKTFEMKGRLQRADLKTNLGQQRRSVWFCHPSNQ